MMAMPGRTNVARDRRRLIVVAVGNVVAVPVYAAEVLQLTQLLLPYFIANAVAVLAGGVIAGAVTWMWMRDVRLGAAVQATAFLPMFLFGVGTTRSLNSNGLMFIDFLDFRIFLAVALMIVVPGILVSVALVTLRRRRARGKS
jgi:hypothetical protein